jgi:hypothetical protein
MPPKSKKQPPATPPSGKPATRGRSKTTEESPGGPAKTPPKNKQGGKRKKLDANFQEEAGDDDTEQPPGDGDDDEEDEPASDDAKGGRDTNQANTKKRTAPRRTTTFVVQSDPTPKLTKLEAANPPKFAVYLHAIDLSNDDDSDKIEMAIQKAATGVFTSNAKKANTWPTFVAAAISEKGDTGKNTFLATLKRHITQPWPGKAKADITKSDDVEEIYQHINDIVDAYEWLAKLENKKVDATDVTDMKVEMLFASLEHEFSVRVRAMTPSLHDFSDLKFIVKKVLAVSNLDKTKKRDDDEGYQPQRWSNNGTPMGALTANPESPHRQQTVQCYNCNTYGHYARDCPSKQHNLGKGSRQQGNYGKGNGKPEQARDHRNEQWGPDNYNHNRGTEWTTDRNGSKGGGKGNNSRTYTEKGSKGGKGDAYNPQQWNQNTLRHWPAPPQSPPPPNMRPLTFQPQQNRDTQQHERGPEQCPRQACNGEYHSLRNCPNYPGCDTCGDKTHKQSKCPKNALGSR